MVREKIIAGNIACNLPPIRETRHLWVGNLPETVREDRIREHFKRYGRVQSVKILLDTHQRPQQHEGATTTGSPNVQLSTATNSTIDYGGGGGGGSGEDRCGALNRANSVNSNSSSGDSCQTTTATAGGGGAAGAGTLGASGSKPNSADCSTQPNSNNSSSSSRDTEATTVNSSTTVIGSSSNNNNINSSSAPTAATTNNSNQVTTTSRTISSSNLSSASSQVGGGGGNGLLLSSSAAGAGSVCATVSFMDIKSASKAHTAEHKFDDRVLTTEYYEPSSLPPVVIGAGSAAANNAADRSPASSTTSSSSSSSMSNNSSSQLQQHQQHLLPNALDSGSCPVSVTSSTPSITTSSTNSTALTGCGATTALASLGVGGGGGGSSGASSQHHHQHHNHHHLQHRSPQQMAEGRTGGGGGSSGGGLSQNHHQPHPTLGSSPQQQQQQKQYSAVGPSSLATRFPSSNNNNTNNNMNSVSVHNSNHSSLNYHHVVPSSTTTTTSMPLAAAAGDIRSPKEDSPYFDRTSSIGGGGVASEHYNNATTSGGGVRRHPMVGGYHHGNNATGNGGGGGSVQGGRRDRLYNRNGSYSNCVVDRSNSLNHGSNRSGGSNIASTVSGGNPWQSSSTLPEATALVGVKSSDFGEGIAPVNVRRSMDHMERRMSESSDGGLKGGINHHHHSQSYHHSTAHNQQPQQQQHHNAHQHGFGAGGGGKALSSSGVFSTNNNNNINSNIVGPRRSRSKLRSGSQTPPLDHHHLPQHHGNHHPHHHQNHVASAAAAAGGGISGAVLGRDSVSSRSHSRSPSSCSSSNSTSSNGSAAGSPTLLQGAAAKLQSEYNNHHHQHSHNHHHHHNQEGGGGGAAGSQSLAAARSSRVSSSGGNSSDQAGPSGGSVGNSSSGGGANADDNKPLAICVRNLPSRSSDTSLKDGLFHEYKKHGKVTSVKVVGQNAERYALVCFKKRDDVEKALEVSRNKLFFGSKIDVVPYVGYDVEDNEFRPYEAELDENHPKATRTLFIGNLEKDISNSELWKHFECFGEIIEIDIKKQGTSAYAFCQYSDIVSVVKAMRKMDGEHLGSNRIKLGFGKSMPTNCVWLDGIAESVSEAHLQTQFNRFGHVGHVFIDPDKHLALVFFEQIQSAQLAVKDMRGFTLRGKKLQIDFASRECQDAFFEKLEKAGHGDRNPNGAVNRADRGTFENRGFTRNYDNQTRSRTSSFSRHDAGAAGNASGRNSGATSPISTSERIPVAGGTTPRGAGRPRTSRYLSNAEYYGDSGSEMVERRNVRSYDEYSQGSAASHDDLYENAVQGPATAPVTGTDQFNYPMRASEASLRINRSNSGDRVGDHLERKSRLGSVGCDSPPPATAIGTRMDVDITSASALANQRRRTEKSPAELRHLQKERVHLLEQLEGCPSSGDEVISPKKRLRYDPTMSGDNALPISGLVNSDANCDPSSNYGHESMAAGGAFVGHHGSSVLLHRKVEVRRLSESSQKLLLAASNNLIGANNVAALNRRPSTDRHGEAHVAAAAALPLNYPHSSSAYQPSSVSKRRKTGDSNCSGGGALSNDLHSTSQLARGLRGSAAHQQHHHHPQSLLAQQSHEASGGESPEGSRPGTPLFDERPENLAPTEPRPMPRDRPHDPMILPLPKWAIQYYQQQRMMKAMEMHSGNAANVASTLPAALSSLSSHHSLVIHSQLSGLAATGTSSPNSVRSSSPKFPGGLHGPVTGFPFGSSNNINSNLSRTAELSHSFVPPSPMSGDPNIEPVSPHRPLSGGSSSNGGSDSEMGSANASPSFDERIKMLDEMLEKVNGCSSRGTGVSVGGSNSGTAPTTPHIPILTSSSIVDPFIRSKDVMESPSFRSRFDVKDVEPSDILKSVLAKKSIFDEDSKRLENIGDKYEPSDYQNLIRNSPQIVSTAAATAFMPMSSPLGNLNPSTPTTPGVAKVNLPPALASQPHSIRAATTTTPLQSPQIAAPLSAAGLTLTTTTAASLNSPVITGGGGGGGGSGSSSSGMLTPVKGLQYPFPSHPPAPVTQPPPMPPLPPLPPTAIVTPGGGKLPESSTSAQPPLPPTPTSNSKVPAMLKSASLHEGGGTSSSKLLAKSLSLPTSGSTLEERNVVTKKMEQEASVSANPTSRDEEDSAAAAGGHHRREHSRHSKSESKNHRTPMPMAISKSKSTEERSKCVTASMTATTASSSNHKKEERKHSERSEKSTEVSCSESSDRDTEERMRKVKHDKENISDQNKVSSSSSSSSKHIIDQVSKREEIVKPMDVVNAAVHKIKEENLSIEESQQQVMTEEKRKHGESRNASPNRALHSKRRLDSTDSTEAEEKRSKLHGMDSLKAKSSSSSSSLGKEKDAHLHKSSSHKSSSSSSSSSKHTKNHSGHPLISKSASLSEEIKPEVDLSNENRVRSMSVDEKGHEELKKAHAAAMANRKVSSHMDTKGHKSMSSSSAPGAESSSVVEDTNAYDREFIDRMEEQQNMKIRSSDEEQQMHMQKMKMKKEKKREKYRRQHEEAQQQLQQQRSGEKSTTACYLRNDDAKSTCSSDNGHNPDQPRKNSYNLSTDDSDDSDGPRKHSIFDIPEEVGPAYISMYDKVKARSCKNMQKQQEEKKIKAKFSQLKQSRAKREGKKSSHWFGSDSEGYNSSTDVDTSDEEQGGVGGHPHHSHHHQQHKKHHHKDLSDMDSDERARYRRQQMRELCDNDTSESSTTMPKNRVKVMSRKNSRSTRIESDSSDDAAPIRKSQERIDLKMSLHPHAEVLRKDGAIVGQEMRLEKDANAEMDKSQMPIGARSLMERAKEMPSADEIPEDIKRRFQWWPFFLCEVEEKKSLKAQKKKKRGKSVADEEEKDNCSPKSESTAAVVTATTPTAPKTPPSSMGGSVDLFDELKKDMSAKSAAAALAASGGERSSCKKKHSSSRKDRRRERSGKEDESRSSKEEKSKARKEKKRSTDTATHDTEFGSMKRDEKMEEIFGPLSDDDTNTSFAVDGAHKGDIAVTHPTATTTVCASSSTVLPGFVKQEIPTKSSPEVGPMSTAPAVGGVKAERVSEEPRSKDEVRKLKKEKKRKERERSRSVVPKEDENSVDLDEAGRALEAQLMNELDTKPAKEDLQPKTVDSQKDTAAAPSHRDMNDVFRMTDGGEDSSENVSVNTSSVTDREKDAEHRHAKEKKKKKKRSKEEKLLRREHSSTSGKQLEADVHRPTQVDPKLAPSLPSLLDDTPSSSSSSMAPTITAMTGEVATHVPTPKFSPVDLKRPVKIEKLIPGFSDDLDRQISESAVKSISAELATKPVDTPLAVKVEPNEDEPLLVVVGGKKLDEKASRALISQEETEDAVAALLGESFASSTDYSEIYPPTADFEEASPPVVTETTAIPDVDAEEMRKAVQSLHTDDLKADTPQSEHDLQIDTDTEQDEVESSKVPKDESAELAKNRKDVSPAAVKPSVITKSSAAAPSVVTSPVKETKADVGQSSGPVVEAALKKPPPEMESKSSKAINLPVNVPTTPNAPGHHSTPQTSPLMNYSPTGAPLGQSPVNAKPVSGGQSSQQQQQHQPPQMPFMSQPQQKVLIQSPGPRPVNPYAVHPPTINIPEQYMVQHMIPSPRAGMDPRMVSPRMHQQFVKASSPQSPTVRGGPRKSPQLSPVMMPGQQQQQQQQHQQPGHPQMMNQQQQQQQMHLMNRQMMSPNSPNQQQMMMTRPGLAPQSPQHPTMVRVVQSGPGTSPGQPMIRPGMQVSSPQSTVRVVQSTAGQPQLPPKMVSKTVIESLPIGQQNPQQVQINIPKPHQLGAAVLQHSPTQVQNTMQKPLEVKAEASENVSVIKSAPVVAGERLESPENVTVIKKMAVEGTSESVKPQVKSQDAAEHYEDAQEHHVHEPSVSKRGRGRGTGRAKKVSVSETVAVPAQSPSVAGKSMEMVDPVTGGVQTRRGGAAKTGPGRKGSRGGRGGRGGINVVPTGPTATPTPTPTTATAVPVPVQMPPMIIPPPPVPVSLPPTGHVPTAAERKARSQNSESDVYEFHDDSGEDVQAGGAGGRPRVILAAAPKGPELSGPQLSSQPQPAPLGTSMSMPVLAPPSVDTMSTILQSMPQLQSPPHQHLEGHQPMKTAADDFTTPSSTNTRKSRRLQERDGTRTTVDDIIEDVVKNVPNSPKSSSSSSAGQTPPRRSTRSASSGSSKGDGLSAGEVASTGDLKKSPRASRKPRKNSENSAESGDDIMMISGSEMRQDMQPMMKREETRPQQHGLVEGMGGPDPTMVNLSAMQQQQQQQHMGGHPGTPIKGQMVSNATSVVTSVVKTLPMDLGQTKHGVDEAGKVGDKVTVQYLHRGPVVSGTPLKQQQLQQHPPQIIAGDVKVSTITANISQAQPVITSSSAGPGGPPPISVQITVPTMTTTQQSGNRAHQLKSHVLNSPQPTMLMVNSEDYNVCAAQQQQQMHSPVISKGGAPQPLPPNIVAQQQQQLTAAMAKAREQGPHPNVVQMQQLSGATKMEQPQNLVVKLQQQQQQHHGEGPGSQAMQQQQSITIHTGPPGKSTMHPVGQSPLIMQGNKIVSHPGQGLVTSYQGVLQQPGQQSVTVSNIVKVPQPPTATGHVIQIPQPGQPQMTPKGPIPQPLNIPSGAKIEYITATAAGGQQIAKVQVPPQVQMSQHQQTLPKGQQLQMGHPLTAQQQQQIQVIQQQQQQAMIQQQAMAKHHMQQQAQQQQGQPPHMLPANKGLHQAPQILTGAVASPPLKQPHLSSQQPIVTGASSSRVSIPHISPQGPSRHMMQAGLPVPGFEANMHGELSGFGMTRSQSPPPAHQQQVSPITPGDFRLSREQFLAYQSYIKAQQEALSLGGARYPSYKSRSPLLPGAIDQNQPEQLDDAMGVGANAPLELRRVNTPGARSTIPQSLQSPGDRATDSPQVAQVYVPGTRFPHPHYPEAGARYYDNPRQSLVAEPPPAHRPHSANPVGVAAAANLAAAAQNLGMVAPAGLPHIYASYQKPAGVDVVQHQQQQQQHHQREREQQQRDREQPRALPNPGHSNMQSHGTLVPALPGPTIGRSLQVATPPHASQVPPQADSLQMLLQRYPVMWQGLLALKNDSAAVQMHFVFGNAQVADDSLPRNVDGPIPLRIAQRMRLEQTQLEGVARKMQTENEHCMLLALPCGRDHMDVLQQSTNLQNGFITYLQQKQAAGIVNIAAPGSQQAAFVVHIFPSCEFANENLARIAPDLLHRVADIAHLLIVIATV